MPAKREQFQHSIRAQYLGERMRQLREDRGLTLKHVASSLGVEFSTLARYERAEWPFRVDHVTPLLDVYGVFQEKQREELVALARNAWRVCAWQVEGVKDTDTSGINEQPVIDPWWIQGRADELCVYAPYTVPPLVRARDYAEAVVRHADPQAPMMKVDVEVRRLAERQQVLDAKPPVRLTVLLEESVLHRRVAGTAVTVAQFEHLTRVVERPHVKVLILPTDAGLHPGAQGGFTLCRMRPPNPPVVLLDQLTGHAVIEADAAEKYNQVFDKLKETALNPTDSMKLIMEAVDRLGGLPRQPAGTKAVAV